MNLHHSGFQLPISTHSRGQQVKVPMIGCQPHMWETWVPSSWPQPWPGSHPATAGTRMVVLRTHRDNRDASTELRPHKDPARKFHLQAKEWGLRRKQPCQHLDLSLPASRAVNQLISILSDPACSNYVSPNTGACLYSVLAGDTP